MEDIKKRDINESDTHKPKSLLKISQVSQKLANNLEADIENQTLQPIVRTVSKSKSPNTISSTQPFRKYLLEEMLQEELENQNTVTS